MNLQQINLYFCKLNSFRDLGTGWPALKIISVYGCTLKDLNGINGFPKLEELYVPFNEVEDISALSFLNHGIRALDLEANQISSDQEIYLEMLKIYFIFFWRRE